MKDQNKEASGANRGFEQNRIAGKAMADFNWKSITDVEKLQSQLAGHLEQHRTVRKLVRCLGCGQPRNPVRMSAIAGVCRECVEALDGKGPTARNRFIESAKANVGRFLRGRLAHA